METTKPQIIRHGEVILKPVSEIPTGAEMQREVKKEVVAHSETGHHHVLESQKPMSVWTSNRETYIQVPGIAELWHDKAGSDTHAPHKVVPSIYKVQIKKEFDYFSGLIQRVRD